MAGRERGFSNTEITLMFQNIDNKLDAIVEQTTKHNGRLTTLEERTRQLENWRSIIVGAISIVTFIGLPNLVNAIIK